MRLITHVVGIIFKLMAGNLWIEQTLFSVLMFGIMDKVALDARI